MLTSFSLYYHDYDIINVDVNVDVEYRKKMVNSDKYTMG